MNRLSEPLPNRANFSAKCERITIAPNVETMVPSYVTRYFFRKKFCRIFTVILNFERLYLENELSFSKKNFTIASFTRLTTNLCKNLRKNFWAGVAL